MCDQLPGSFTSSIPAIVSPRNTSSETNRSRVVGTAGVPASAASVDVADRGGAELAVAIEPPSVGSHCQISFRTTISSMVVAQKKNIHRR